MSTNRLNDFRPDRKKLLERICSAIYSPGVPTHEQNETMIQALLQVAATVELADKGLPYSSDRVTALADAMLEALEQFDRGGA